MDESTTPRRKASWRGTRSGRHTEPQRRWQRPATPGATGNGRGSRIPLWLRLGGLLVAMLMCLGVYLYLILSRPLQVPVIAITAPAYPNSIPPNGWSTEDVAGLADLDGATITLHDAHGTGATRSAILESLQQRLDDAQRANPHGPLVIFFSLHAAVDGSGRPCLIPPRSSWTDSSTWLPVEDLFATIADHARSERSEVLVVFDTNRLDVEWQLGIARNTFVERLGALMNSANGPRKRIPLLAVLTAAGVDEVSHTSRALGGSAFGHFLRQGLAGHADQSEFGGNTDSRVGLRELQTFLANTVTNWARDKRDAAQTPVLFAADGVDFPITWVCRTHIPERTAAPPAVSAATVADLWLRAERLERHNPTRTAPLVWADVRKSLHYLEQAASAGTGYESIARTTAELLDSRLTRFERQSASGDIDRWNIFRTDDGAPPVAIPAHSLALRRTLGRSEGAHGSAWNDLPGAISASRLSSLADEIDLPGSGPVNEAHFLRLLAQSPAASLAPERLGRVIALHRLGETAAAPVDERAWPWISDSIIRGDAARRIVEDAAMAAAAPETKSYETAETIYRQALDRGDRVSSASQLLDNVLADQVFLARWLTDPRHRLADEERRERHTELINTVLLPMINDAHELARELNNVTKDGASGIEARSEAIRSQFQRLNAEFDRAYARLLDIQTRDAGTLREIDLVLSTPLLPSTERQSLSPAQQRAVLVQRRAEIAQDLAANDDAGKPTEASPIDSWHQRTVSWQTHPLAKIVDEALPTGTNVPQTITDPLDAERLGQLTRNWLASLAQGTRPTIALRESATADTEPDSDATAPTEGPQHLRGVVTQLRTAASLLTTDEITQAESVARLAELDRAVLLLGHAQRKLADFWGPTDPTGGPFFALAKDDLEAAETLAAFDRDVTSTVAETDRFLALRIEAANRGMRVDVSDVLQTTPDRAAKAVVAVLPGLEEASAGVPQGMAVVVAGHPGRWTLATPTSVRVPVAENAGEFELEIGSTETVDSPTSARVGVLYRGNLFDAPLMTSAPTGPAVAVTVPETTPTTLTVRSTHRQGLSVVFVLDCSGSMAEGEGSEGFAGASNRLDLARSALSRMLAELSTRPQTRVGVVFYGHRVGWRKVEMEDAPNRFQRAVQRNYARNVPDAIMPYNDVEIVEPLGRFDGAVAGEVETLLESLRPWGETPLYLAIDEALRQFGDDDAQTERSVIVITDGLNEQSNPSPSAYRTAGDVLSTWETHRAAIEIIGFGVSEGDAGRAATEFGQLAETTGGSYESAGRATELLAALERRIGPAAYRVRPSSGGDGTSAPVGTPVVLTDLAGLPSAFQVSLDSQQSQVSADGGEALELLVGDAGPMLSARYLTGARKFLPLTSDDDRRSGKLLGLHRPIRTSENGVTFEFSLQNEDQRFLPRPGAVWVEVTPVRTEGGAATPYVYFHELFLPRTPVPVLRWTAANWPEDAESAQVRFWCRDEAAKPTAVLSLAELLQSTAPTTVPGLDHVTFEAYPVDDENGVRIEIIERHAAGSAGIGRIAVTCEETPAVRQIGHQFDAEHNMVLHTLRFAANSDQEAIDQLSIRISTRADVEAGGLRLEPPTVIDIADRADLLVPYRSPYTSDLATEGDANQAVDDAGAAPLLRAPGPDEAP